MSLSQKDKRKMRRIALRAQGLAERQPFGRGIDAVAAAIRQLGYVQIDTISVVQRAHHHVLWSRVPGYRLHWLDQLVQQRQIFEYWFHAAAYLPIEDYRFALPRMHAIRDGQIHWFRDVSKKDMRNVLARITAEGPLRARDFAETATGKSGWWDWKPAKQALEQLFIQGQLMVTGREGFQKRYDIVERALPAGIDTRFPSAAEQAAHLIDVTLRAHGFASRKSFSYLRKGSELRKAIVNEIAAREAAGRLTTLDWLDDDNWYTTPEILQSEAGRITKKIRILSPFDNSVIQRERLSAVFEFSYQIECYVPAAKRRYGYFCLPLLYGDEFIGRMDCKAHRKQRILEILSLHLEKKVSDSCVAAIHSALREFLKFNDCDTLQLSGNARSVLNSLAVPAC